jgi:hypothetical protein
MGEVCGLHVREVKCVYAFAGTFQGNRPLGSILYKRQYKTDLNGNRMEYYEFDSSG